MTDETPSFWSRLLSALSRVGAFALHYLAGPLLAVGVIALAFFLISMGLGKDLQIGGLLGRLLGRDPPEKKAIDVANSVDRDRVGPDGKLIEPGQPDSKGQTQAVVVPIQPPHLFSDPGTVTFTSPGADKPVVVQLPDGVTEKDVDQVVVVSPEVTVVTVKNDSGVSAKSLDDILSRYGSL